jgi:hypothetical protein
MWHFVNMPPHTWEYWHVIFVTYTSQKANAVLHPGLVLHYVEDGLGNSVK